MNLAKCPASTVQILGAEKALFRYVVSTFVRHLLCGVTVWWCAVNYVCCLVPSLLRLILRCSAIKTKGNTPKYGLIFHSSFIGRAAAKNKGRVARCLGNKCSMASRIDAFSGTHFTLTVLLCVKTTSNASSVFYCLLISQTVSLLLCVAAAFVRRFLLTP